MGRQMQWGISKRVQSIGARTLIEQSQDQRDILTGDSRVKQSPVVGNSIILFDCINVGHCAQTGDGFNNSGRCNYGLETYVD